MSQIEAKRVAGNQAILFDNNTKQSDILYEYVLETYLHAYTFFLLGAILYTCAVDYVVDTKCTEFEMIKINMNTSPMKYV